MGFSCVFSQHAKSECNTVTTLYSFHASFFSEGMNPGVLSTILDTPASFTLSERRSTVIFGQNNPVDGVKMSHASKHLAG